MPSNKNGKKKLGPDSKRYLDEYRSAKKKRGPDSKRYLDEYRSAKAKESDACDTALSKRHRKDKNTIEEFHIEWKSCDPEGSRKPEEVPEEDKLCVLVRKTLLYDDSGNLVSTKVNTFAHKPGETFAQTVARRQLTSKIFEHKLLSRKRMLHARDRGEHIADAYDDFKRKQARLKVPLSKCPEQLEQMRLRALASNPTVVKVQRAARRACLSLGVLRTWNAAARRPFDPFRETLPDGGTWWKREMCFLLVLLCRNRGLHVEIGSYIYALHLDPKHPSHARLLREYRWENLHWYDIEFPVLHF